MATCKLCKKIINFTFGFTYSFMNHFRIIQTCKFEMVSEKRTRVWDKYKENKSLSQITKSKKSKVKRLVKDLSVSIHLKNKYNYKIMSKFITPVTLIFLVNVHLLLFNVERVISRNLSKLMSLV